MKYYDDKPINPREYIYINGLGFANNLPSIKEKQLLKSYSCMAGVSIILMYFLSFFGHMTLTSLLGRTLFRFFPFLSSDFVYYIGYIGEILTYLISILLPFFLYTKILGMPLSVALPFKKTKGKRTLGILGMSMGCSAISVIATAMFIRFMNVAGFDVYASTSSIPSDLKGILMYAAFSIVIVAFVEEIVFRGFLLQSLRRFGDGFAILMTATIFAAFHANFYQFPVAFIMGIVLGFSVTVTGSLWTGIFVHMLHNGYLIVTALMQENLTYDKFMLFICSLFAIYIVISIISLINLAKKSDYIFDLDTGKTICTIGQKTAIYFTTFPMILVIAFIIMRTLSYVHFRF